MHAERITVSTALHTHIVLADITIHHLGSGVLDPPLIFSCSINYPARLVKSKTIQLLQQ
jgi:hypothetical protein